MRGFRALQFRAEHLCTRRAGYAIVLHQFPDGGGGSELDCEREEIREGGAAVAVVGGWDEEVVGGGGGEGRLCGEGVHLGLRQTPATTASPHHRHVTRNRRQAESPPEPLAAALLL